MTRRAIPQKTLDYVFNDFRHAYYEASLDWLTEKEALDQCFFVDKMKNLPYKIGEEVAIAQRYEDIINEIFIAKGYETEIATLVYQKHKGWKNKMFVRADDMRHFICMSEIKIERLQDITDDDCLREGVYASNSHEVGYGIPWVYTFSGTKIAYCTPREAFAALIDKVSGKGTWKSNPCVFAYGFELVR